MSPKHAWYLCNFENVDKLNDFVWMVKAMAACKVLGLPPMFMSACLCHCQEEERWSIKGYVWLAGNMTLTASLCFLAPYKSQMLYYNKRPRHQFQDGKEERKSTSQDKPATVVKAKPSTAAKDKPATSVKAQPITEGKPTAQSKPQAQNKPQVVSY